jgi:hypothetical protein
VEGCPEVFNRLYYSYHLDCQEIYTGSISLASTDDGEIAVDDLEFLPRAGERYQFSDGDLLRCDAGERFRDD